MFCEPSGFETGLATNPKGWSWRQLFLSARSRFSAAMSVTAQLWALAFFWCQTCAHSHRFRQPGGNSQFAAGTKGRRSKFQHVQGVLLVDKLAVRSRNQKGEGVNSSSIQRGLQDFVDVSRITSLHDIFTLLQAPFFGSIALEQPVRGRSTRKPTNGAESSSSVLASRRGSPPEAGRAAAKEVHALVELVAEGARHPGDGPL